MTEPKVVTYYVFRRGIVYHEEDASGQGGFLADTVLGGRAACNTVVEGQHDRLVVKWAHPTGQVVVGACYARVRGKEVTFLALNLLVLSEAPCEYVGECATAGERITCVDYGNGARSRTYATCADAFSAWDVTRAVYMTADGRRLHACFGADTAVISYHVGGACKFVTHARSGPLFGFMGSLWNGKPVDASVDELVSRTRKRPRP